MKISEAFKKEFFPNIEKERESLDDHLTCGNQFCFYDGKWCYHLTDIEFNKMIKFLEQFETNN